MTAQITTLKTGTAQASDSTYRIKGGKVGVLLIHGLCGTPVELRFVAAGLGRAGYTVHCPLLAGHGGSRKDIVKTGWKDWYKSAETALIELRKECDTVIVGGLCLGGLIGMQLAANHPDKVQGLTLLSPTIWANGWAMPWYFSFFRLVHARWFANLMHFPDANSLGIKDDRIRDFVRSALAATDGTDLGSAGTPGGTVLEHRRLSNATRKIVGQVNQPTLIIHSREDDYAALDNAVYLQGKISGAVDLVVLDDSFHMITLDKQRHVVVERTLGFIERVVTAMKTAAATGTVEKLTSAA